MEKVGRCLIIVQYLLVLFISWLYVFIFAVLGDCKVASYDTFILLSFTSGGQSLRWFSLVSAGRFLPEALSPCLFQFLETVCVPWLMACFSVFKASRIASPNFLFWLPDSSAPFFSHLSIHVIYWAHPHNLGIFSLFQGQLINNLIPSVTIISFAMHWNDHWFWGLRHGYIWETLIHLTTHYFLQSWEAFSKYLFFEYFWILKYLLSWILGFLHLYMYFMTFAINYFSFDAQIVSYVASGSPFQVGS